MIPARDEADGIAAAVGSLLAQDYPGGIRVVVVDDASSDGTADVARAAARGDDRLIIVPGQPLAAEWTGKLWAVDQGVGRASERFPQTEFLLLCDADIVHARHAVRRLVAKAESERLDLVSLMVKLRCLTVWERLLIPAFVFFFRKLYPFSWVADKRRRTAAAAGGCMLVRRSALERAGGIRRIRDRVIDDCALAAAVKGAGGAIWLGMAQESRSLRSYEHLDDIWRMVARTAFVQLDHSVLMLGVTILGMIVIYVAPVIGVVSGLALWEPAILAAAASTWVAMVFAYRPTALYYGLSLFSGFLLPFVAALYTLMTIDSALRHWRGFGNPWKGRRYDAPITGG